MQGYFFLYVSPQQILRPPLKTSVTDFTWRQRLNEYGSTYFNKCHISFGFATLFQKRRLAQNLEKYTFLCGILPKTSFNHNAGCWRTPFSCMRWPDASSQNWIISQQSSKTLKTYVGGIFTMEQQSRVNTEKS